jgi:hypothetical protein
MGINSLGRLLRELATSEMEPSWTLSSLMSSTSLRSASAVNLLAGCVFPWAAGAGALWARRSGEVSPSLLMHFWRGNTGVCLVHRHREGPRGADCFQLGVSVPGRPLLSLKVALVEEGKEGRAVVPPLALPCPCLGVGHRPLVP